MGTMSSLCAECGELLPDAGCFCPACGTPVAGGKVTYGKAESLPDRLAAASAYLFVILAVFFLLKEPFKNNRFIRFHAWQSILAAGAFLLISVLLVAMMGHVLVILAAIIYLVGCFIAWLVLMIKSLQGEFFELPGLGQLGERLAGPVHS